MAVVLPEGKQSFTTATGAPGVGYRLYAFVPGTSTPKDTYTTSAASVANTHPVVMDARGEATIYWDGSYDVVLRDAADALIWGPERLEDAGDTLRTDLADTSSASNGDALIGVLHSGTGSLARTQHDRNEDDLHLSDKGTTADMLTALNDAYADFATGGRIQIERGTWVLSDTATFTGQRIHLDGMGRQVSIVSFTPASAKAALVVNEPSAGGSNQGSITGLGFTSTGGNTQVKTAIRLVNVANYEVGYIGIATGAWLGDSIGIKTEGRQYLHIHDCEIGCHRPLVVGNNATYPTLSSDLSTFERLELIGNSASFPAMEFEDGTTFANVTIKNTDFIKGGHGLYWNDTTSTGASFCLTIQNCRSEQGLDSAAYSVYLASTAQNLQTLIIDNFITDTARNGFYFRNCQRVTLRNVIFNTTTGTALDMTFVAGSRLILENCTRTNSAAVITLTNARCVHREFVTGMGMREEWIYDAGASAGQIASDVYHGGTPQVVANDASIVIANNTFVGFAYIMTSEDISAIYCLRGPTQTVSEVSDTSGVFTPTLGTASSYNVAWDGGTSFYRLENKRGGSRTVSIYLVGAVI